MPAATRSFETESNDSMCRPVVIGLTPPTIDANWMFRAP